MSLWQRASHQEALEGVEEEGLTGRPGPCGGRTLMPKAGISPDFTS